MAEYTVRWPQHIDRWLSEGDSTPEEELLVLGNLMQTVQNSPG